MPKNSFYITTTIPYVNADPHIGFALELVQSDAIARYQRLIGREVFFSTGTDEYGQKIWEASQKQGKPVQEYVDHYAQVFLDLTKSLNLSVDNFIRTTSKEHIEAAQKFWRLCDTRGDIYKKKYQGLYCVGCEKFIVEKDLIDGKCAFHPTLTPEMVEEENYFFRLGKYKEELLEYLNGEKAIIPEWRRKEAIDFVENAIEDFSVSRSKERLTWGVPIPDDDTQVMYVWFGAFVNYISTLGWPNQKEKFEKFWTQGETVQTAGKDMVKFQSVMWQGMLMSAGIKTTDIVVYHGFVTGEGGIRMSKSLGNVINPNDIVKEYGTDALRYFLLREISSFEDSPFTMERFKEAYNSGLANGLGNLVSRILTMAENYGVAFMAPDAETVFPIENFNIKEYADKIWAKIADADKKIQETEPYKLFKFDPSGAKKIITELTHELYQVALALQPLLPETAKKMIELIKNSKKPEKPLFLRKE
ncbi:methionine--tRNA ligase [Candidatus Nomurabacteria bacterium]|nr:methionine--tRNA ligase [Candidatus Nomurabacteria bacterium]